MAVALVGSAGAIAQVLGGTTITPVFAQATTAGHTLIACVSSSSPGGPDGTHPHTCSNGTWTLLGGFTNTANGSPYGVSFWMKANCGASETAPSFGNGFSGNVFAQLTEWSGLGTSPTADVVSMSGTGQWSAASPHTSVVTMASADTANSDLFLAGFFLDDGGKSATVTVGSPTWAQTGGTATVTHNGATKQAFHTWFGQYVIAGNGGSAADSASVVFTASTGTIAGQGYGLSVKGVTSANLSRTGTDSAPATDDAVRAVLQFQRTGSDTASLSDIVASALRRLRTGTDSLGGTDSAVKGATVRQGADSLGGTDVASRVRIGTRTAADTAKASDEPSSIVDNFNRTNNGTSLGTTSDGKATWVDDGHGSTWGIFSNAAVNENGAAGGKYIETGQSNGTIQATLITASSLKIALMFGWVDTSNYWLVRVNTSGAQLIQVWGGSPFLVGSFAFSSGDVIKVVMTGVAAVTVFKNGTSVVTYDGATDGHASPGFGTKHGVYSDGILTGSASVDDFSFIAADGVAPGAQVGKARTASDTAAATDAATKSAQQFARTVADTAAATDIAGEDAFHFRTAADTAHASDVDVPRVVLAPRPLSDSAPAVDTNSRVRAPSPRTTSDSLPLTDIAGEDASFQRTSADTAAATDVAGEDAFPHRATSDALGGSDVATRHDVYARAVSDTAAATDVASGAVTTPSIARTASDNLGVTDVVARVQRAARTASDSAPATDAATRSATAWSRTTADSAPATETLTRSMVEARTASDTAGVSDSTARITALLRFASDGGVVITEDFSSGTLPSDITPYGSSGVANTVVVSDFGNPTPALKGTGNNDGWYFTGSRFQVVGDFDISYDLNINPDGTTTRDIANFAFWINTPGASANGFMLRLQVGGGDGGFFKVTNGGHSLMSGGGLTFVGPLANANQISGVTAATWYRVRLQAVGNVVTATVTRLSDSVQQVTGSIDLTSALDATHTTSGTFGQKLDGAASTIGHRWDNISLAGVASFDSATRTVTAPRVVSDSLGGTDSASSGGTHQVTASDSAAATDSVAQVVRTARTGSDAAPATDALLRTVVDSRTTSDVAHATDVATRAAQSLARTTADSAPATDVASRAAQQFTRATSDLAPAVDVASRTVRDARTGSDTAPASDSATRVLAQARATTDAVGGTDSASRTVAEARAVTDAAPATDAASRGAQAFARAASDATPATDVAARVVREARTGADSLPAIDSATRALAQARSVSDAAPATDATSRAGAAQRTSSDTAPATDAASRQARDARTTADVAGLTDVASRQATEARTASDAAAAVDVASRAAQLLARTTTDVAAATDSATPHDVRSRSTTDSAPATDVASQRDAYARSSTDNAAATDGTARAMAASRSGVDSAPATDSASRAARWARIGTDGAALVDSAALQVRLGTTGTDSAPATDSAASGRVLGLFAADGAAAADVVTRAMRVLRNLADSAPAVDTASGVKSIAPRDVEVILGERLVVISFGDPRLASIAFGPRVDHVVVGEAIPTVATFGQPLDRITVGARKQVVSVGEREDPITLGTPGL